MDLVGAAISAVFFTALLVCAALQILGFVCWYLQWRRFGHGRWRSVQQGAAFTMGNGYLFIEPRKGH